MKIVRTFCYESGNKQAIRSNSVYALLVDREGVIWIGFYQLGLDYTLYQERIIFYLCLSSLFRLQRDACSCNSCFERRETDRFAQWTFLYRRKETAV